MADYPIAPKEWAAVAACAGVGTDFWFPEKGNPSRETTVAIAICEDCPCIEECREFALADPLIEGIWGGLTASQRARVRRMRKDQR